MTSFIKVPFASSGDKAAVPDTDAGGGVNMTQGYGQAYSLDPATDPSAKRIERDKMNWLFNRITQAINEIQSGGVAPFITSADNGGSAFSYGKGALVSLSGVVYQSLVASNTSTPPGANWSALPEKIQPLDATLTALAGLVGAANKIPYFNGVDAAELTELTQVGRDIIGKTDITAVLQYLGLGAGVPAIGIPFFWPSTVMPDTVMDEWSDMVFLKFNGATFSAATYPKLAKVFPGLRLTEARGEFLRVWDDGRGIDSGRSLLSPQGDAIRNITGSLGFITMVGNTVADGAFTAGGAQNIVNLGVDGNPTTLAQFAFFNAANAGVPVAAENRPRNISFNLLVRAK